MRIVGKSQKTKAVILFLLYLFCKKNIPKKTHYNSQKKKQATHIADNTAQHTQISQNRTYTRRRISFCCLCCNRFFKLSIEIYCIIRFVQFIYFLAAFFCLKPGQQIYKKTQFSNQNSKPKKPKKKKIKK